MNTSLLLFDHPSELNAFKNVIDNKWLESIDCNQFSYSQTQFQNCRITLAQTAKLSPRFIAELNPNFVAMTGVCTGNADEVKPGDVIVASKIFQIDAGKATPEGFFQNVTTYTLKPQWQQRLANFPADWGDRLETPRPKTYAHQKGWFLHTLYDHELKPDLCHSPADHPNRGFHCPDWEKIIEQLVSENLFNRSTCRLTPAAIDFIRENRILHLETGFPHDPADPEVHLGVIAATSSIKTDPELFDRIKTSAGQHNILGVAMAAETLRAIAAIHDIPMIVIKAVQDAGDRHKSDQFRAYTAEVSARFLLVFLQTIDLK